MTPNPQNIGAAPEGLTLEVGKTYENADGSERFHIFMRHGEHVHPFVFRATRLKTGGVVNFGAAGEYWPGEAPHLWDLAREVPDAAGVPEPQAKGPSPSEVPQPGEGVDLGLTPAELGLGLDAVAAWILDRLGPDREANEKFLEAQLSELQIFSIELGRKQVGGAA